MTVQASDLAGGLLVRGGRLLLGRRALHKADAPGAWDLFGGHVEPGETSEAALVRELREELGITPTAWTLMETFALPGGGRYRTYVVRAWLGGEPRLNDDEHSDLAWFSLDEACALPSLAADAYRSLFVRALSAER